MLTIILDFRDVQTWDIRTPSAGSGASTWFDGALVFAWLDLPPAWPLGRSSYKRKQIWIKDLECWLELWNCDRHLPFAKWYLPWIDVLRFELSELELTRRSSIGMRPWVEYRYVKCFKCLCCRLWPMVPRIVDQNDMILSPIGFVLIQL